MKKILFVCGNPPHSVHKKFAESIGADFFHYPEENLKKRILGLWKIPKNYDIYFTEGLFNYVILSRSLGFLKKSARIINLFSDPRLFQIVSGKKFDFQKLKIKRYPFIKRKLAKRAIKKLDGAICIGKFEYRLLKKISDKVPSTIVYAFIKKGFISFNSKLEKNNILFIGNGPDYYYKGIDLLIKIFLKVRKNQQNSKLYIIGKDLTDFQKKFKKYKNIKFLGKQDFKGIKKYMKECSLYCHFGRGEAFGVSVLEAMATGIPCIVSKFTGAKEAVEKVNSKFVFSLEDKERIVNKILEYFKKSQKEKLKLGKKFKKQAKFFNEKNCINLFKQRFSELINEIK